MTTGFGFVGLGAMGSRLARRLLDAGHPVVGWNRTPSKAEALASAGLHLGSSPRAVAEAASIVFTMVTDDAALRAVMLGDQGVLAGLRHGSVVVEMSTVSPATVQEIAAAVAACDAALLDAPVSGSTITVEQGQASIVVGGDADVLDRVRPALTVMGPGGITHVGAIGMAKTMKLATNLGLAVQMLAFSEAVLLAEKSGIPRATAVEALLRSVIASPMIKYRGPFVLGQMPRTAWFDVAMIQKDLHLALDHGRAIGVPLPSTALVQEWMTMARGFGLGQHDFAVVFDVLARASGLAPSARPGTGT